MHVESWPKVLLGALVGLGALGWWLHRGDEPIIPLMVGALGLFILQEGVVVEGGKG